MATSKTEAARALQRGDMARTVFDALDARIRIERPRDYIGASVVATPCDRALFYVKERVAATPVEARALRIFEFGDAIERLTIRWLRDAHFHVYDIDPATNDQFHITTIDRTLQGHLDGILSRQSLMPDLFNLPTVGFTPVFYFLEIKSHNDNRWNEVVDTGVKNAKWEHYSQLQTYLKHSRTIARRSFCIDAPAWGGLYIAVNKNTSEVYIEEVPFDDTTAVHNEQRASRIASQIAPPPRLATKPTVLPCKYCDFKTHCFNDNRAVQVPKRVGHADRPDARAKTTVRERAILRNPEWGL